MVELSVTLGTDVMVSDEDSDVRVVLGMYIVVLDMVVEG